MIENYMRIGLVIYGTLDTISGGYLYDRQLVEYLRHAGDTVEIFSIPWRNYARHLSDNFSSELFRRLRDARVDVMLQDELNHPSLFQLNWRLRRVVRYPILSIVHHLRSNEAHPMSLLWLYRWVERRYLASVDGFVFNSNTTRDAVRHILGHAHRHFSSPLRGSSKSPRESRFLASLEMTQNNISNSVVAYPAGDRLHPQINSKTIASRAHESPPLRIVFVGNLIPRKGLHTLIAALTQLPAHTWQCTIVGNPDVDANYARTIRRQIKNNGLENVRLVGVLPDDALANLLAQSHVLVVPSDYEGFGIVYLEGMSFGLPAIATTSGAASEIITDGMNGFLIASNDSALLVNRIAALYNDRELLARMSIAARERFLAHPCWEESMAKIRNYLEQ